MNKQWIKTKEILVLVEQEGRIKGQSAQDPPPGEMSEREILSPQKYNKTSIMEAKHTKQISACASLISGREQVDLVSKPPKNLSKPNKDCEVQ
ncbi:hypothetical protein Ddc_09524 [Ditylenchus destructor]|nr:hypothetical protein Ddc_24347 [Ditylenchus destructor]KAI1718471.1 hypothetical protein Ddc_09524 [Ditylenchus destructor]